MLYLASEMGLHYVTFMGRHLENMKKLTSIRIMNSASMNSKNIMNSVGIFNVNGFINNIFNEQYMDEECFM